MTYEKLARLSRVAKSLFPALPFLKSEISWDDCLEIVRASRSRLAIDGADPELLQLATGAPAADLSDVMIPRTMMPLLSEETTVGEARDVCFRFGYRHLPVASDTIDRPAGMISALDLLSRSVSDADPIGTLLRDVPYVPLTNEPIDVLRMLQEQGAYMAVVLDEYGGVSGIVTKDALVGTLFGLSDRTISSEMPLGITEGN